MNAAMHDPYEYQRRHLKALDAINPHFLILSATHEGGDNARAVTAAITRFVNENVARATRLGNTRTLPSVTKWVGANKPRSPRVTRRRQVRASAV